MIFTDPNLNFCYNGGYMVGPHASIPADKSVYLQERDYKNYFDSKAKFNLIGCNSMVCDKCTAPVRFLDNYERDISAESEWGLMEMEIEKINNWYDATEAQHSSTFDFSLKLFKQNKVDGTKTRLYFCKCYAWSLHGHLKIEPPSLWIMGHYDWGNWLCGGHKSKI